jgi:predicted phage terminase large subunit-like protein
MCSWKQIENLPDGRKRITLRDPREHDGDLLWPARFGETEVVVLENNLLQYASSQLQQNPVDRAGGIIKEEWIKYWSHGGSIPGTVAVPPIGNDLQSWDCSFKGKVSSDPVCGGLWRRAGGRFFLLDVEWGQWDFPALLEAVKRLCRRWPRVIRKVVEDKANGPALIASLQTDFPGFEPCEPYGDKEARVSSIAPLFKAGLVFLPHPTLFPWVNGQTPYGQPGGGVMELIRFPRGRHDDFVDMTSQGLSALYVGGSNLPEVLAAMHGDPSVRRLLGR